MTSTLRPTAQHAVAGRQTSRRTDRSFVRRNALGLASLAIFAVFLVGMTLTGHATYNADQLEHGGSAVSLVSYASKGHFWEALFENWESEFLQMASYVVLTVFLVQKGSAESKDPEHHDPVDDDPRDADLRKRVPWPLRRGGVWLVLYENSLLLVFTALFIGSLVGHAVGGVDAYNADLRAHGQSAVDTWGYFTGSQFWFEAFRNWQSEFLAVFCIVVLSIFLRQRGSAESKPVAATNDITGTA